MERIKNTYKAFTIMFSETIWIYYFIVMVTSIEQNRPASFNITWWIAAALIGYVLNAVLSRVNQPVLALAGNILAAGFIIIQNFRSVIPKGAFGFGLAVSIALGFIFVRSARLIYKDPSRPQMSLHFGGNVMIYIFFAGIFTLFGWENKWLHVLFMFAVVISLMGILFTLESNEEPEENHKIEIMKVGQSGWFIKVVAVLLLGVLLISLILLLPQVNGALGVLVKGVSGVIKGFFQGIGNFFKWLNNLIPDAEQGEGGFQTFIRKIKIRQPKDVESRVVRVPSRWMVWVIFAAAAIAVLWIVLKTIKKPKPSQSVKLKNITITRESLWVSLREKLRNGLKYLNLKWRMCFPYFYPYPVYWYYTQLVRWGKKNGVPRIKSETSLEYVEKLIRHIPEAANSFVFEGQSYYLSELLKELNKSYQATYYGKGAEEFEEREYKLLVNQLKGIRLLNKKTR